MKRATVDRVALVGRDCTLDGRAAKVCGRILDYAIIVTLDGKARYEDNGTLRKVTLGIPDTYFTIPALTSAGIKGYVDVDDNGDFHFHASRK